MPKKKKAFGFYKIEEQIKIGCNVLNDKYE